MLEDHKHKLLKLVEKYLNDTATEEERQLLESYYGLFDDAPPATELLSDEQLQNLELSNKHVIDEALEPAIQRTTNWGLYLRIAAMFVVSLGIIWLVKTTLFKTVTQPHIVTKTLQNKETINRFITLPDGSKIVLHKNSRLKLAPDFNHSNRTVYLTGEAFFDVSHQKNSPFVIYTGSLKTTVLGTAFNIKAWPEQKDIIVSVTRGKVKVESKNKVLAFLTPDQQITYNTETSIATEPLVETSEAIAWLQQDMTFDEMPFKDLANLLSKRYGMPIEFSNPELENCKFTGRFSGTETLEETLRTLSLTSNTQYSILPNKVLITGEKCY